MAVTRLATHLWFDVDAVPAAELYTSLLPDSRIDRVQPAGPGIPGPMDEGDPLIVDLTLLGNAYTFFNGGPQFPFDSQVSLAVVCETQDDVDRLWSALLEGGGKEVACGWLADRFGLSWQIVPKRFEELMTDPDRGVRERVTQAMLRMMKLDVAALEAAARG
jgi:predicted 3-demethylubiquinone-9 3-methyltransferase (glyoxalase superfamily)